jgi:hypothetical protein
MCNCLLVNFLHIYDMKYVNNLCVQIDTSGKKIKIQTVKDKILPTPIKLNRVDKFLSSRVDSCLLWTVRIFNIVTLHFGEWGGTNLLLSVASLGRWQADPVSLATSRWQHLLVATVILISKVREVVTYLLLWLWIWRFCTFLLVKFLLLYDMKYVNNLLVQIDTSATSSYTTVYTNIVI